MAAPRSGLPALSAGTKGSSSWEAGGSVWLRISAFLSMKAPKTQETYSGILQEWCRFLGAEAGTAGSASKMTSASELHAVAYRKWLEARPGEKPRAGLRGESSGRQGLPAVERRSQRAEKKTGLEATQSNATIAKKLAALRRIYRVLLSAGVGVTINPFATDIMAPPAKDSGRKRPTEMVQFERVLQLVAAASDATAKGLRDKAILAVLFGGALRRGEALELRIGDVRSTPKGTVFLYLRSTKAKRDAQQALPKWAAQIVKRLVEARIQQGGKEADYLFISYVGKGGSIPSSRPLSPSGLYKLFLAYCRKAGLPGQITPHSARATAITKLLAQGIPHREVKEFSRHASIQMVELYDKRRSGVDENVASLLEYEE
jgi:integrase